MSLQFTLSSALKIIFTIFLAEFPNATDLRKAELPWVDSEIIHRAPFRTPGGLLALKAFRSPFSQGILEPLPGFLLLYLLLDLTNYFTPEELRSEEYFLSELTGIALILFQTWQLLKFLGVLWGMLPLPTGLCKTEGGFGLGWWRKRGKQLTRARQLRATMLNRCSGIRSHS